MKPLLKPNETRCLSREAGAGQLVRTQVVGTALAIALLFAICFAALYVCGLSWRGFLIVSNTTIMLGPVIFSLWRGTFDLFEPILMADFAMMGMYVGRPLSDIVSGNFHEGRYDISATWDTALLLVTVANIALQLGYALPIGQTILHYFPVKRSLFRARFAQWWAGFLSVLGIVLFGLFLASQGGVTTLLRMASGRAGEQDAGSGDRFMQSTAYLYNGYALLVPASTLMFGLYLSTKRRRYLIASVVLMTPYVIIMAGGGSRSGLIGLLFGLPALWYIWNGKRPNILTLVVCGVTIAFFFSFIREYRVIENRQNVRLNTYAEDPVETVLQLFTTDDDEMFDVVAEIISVTPNWIPFRHFGVVTDVLVRAVPRTLWPVKPIEMSENVFATLEPERYAYSRAGTAPSIVGDLYLDSGFISVTFWMFMFGLLLRITWDWLLRNPKSIVVLMIFSTIPGAIIYTMRANLAGYLAMAFFTSFPIILFAILQRFSFTLFGNRR